MRVLTGIDLPYGSPGGSMELVRDIYLGPDSPLPADVFMLPPEHDGEPDASGLPALLPVTGKSVSGEEFWSYVDRLTTQVLTRFSAVDYEVIHCQHLTFGATPSLMRAFPAQSKIALVHGTDLLYAEENPTQAEVLRQTVAAAAAVVVPTRAMESRLRRISPVSPRHVRHIPWGVPDELLRRRPSPPERRHGTLRVLYAGRLSAEKITSDVVETIAGLAGVTLSVAAPVAEYARLADRTDMSRVRYLGWLSREQLWREFRQHDALIVPSLKLEAFGLVVIEAQACALPVLYQPVPGLAEVMGDSGIPVDFGKPRELATLLARVSRSRTALDDIRSAGLTNCARFPLSRTVAELAGLSATVAR
ncbi:glycosyltransferase family 4 protein [Streptomyces sp. B6B3]|uniref:glycosyltransferase family 4 protein n=1 Tax=Streptomyces sp. B6B3 TaxID=3153570 RepID=UPI00325EEDDD